MAVQCAARFTMTLGLPGKKKPFITFRCERPAHAGNEHYTTGKGPLGEDWKMWWTLPEQRRELCVPS